MLYLVWIYPLFALKGESYWTQKKISHTSEFLESNAKSSLNTEKCVNLSDFHYMQLPPAWCSCLMCPLAVQFQKIKIFIHLVLGKITNFLEFISVSIWVWQLCSVLICSMERRQRGGLAQAKARSQHALYKCSVTSKSRGADLCPHPPCLITVFVTHLRLSRMIPDFVFCVPLCYLWSILSQKVKHRFQKGVQSNLSGGNRNVLG